MNEIPGLVASPVDEISLFETCCDAKQPPTRKFIKSSTPRFVCDASGDTLQRCSNCWQYKHTSSFYKNQGWCKSCQQDTSNHVTLSKSCSLRLFGQKSIGTARAHQKRLNNSTLTFDIDLDFFINRIELQGGRGFYSGIPMEFKPNCNWKCSLERLNNQIGYTRENVVLETWELIQWTILFMQ